LVKESKDLNIPLDEYRRLYKLSQSKWAWTGFREKRLWDFLQLLLVPIIIYAATSCLGDQAKKRDKVAADEAKGREKEAAEETKKNEKQAADDRARQETLSSYFNEITNLSIYLGQKITPDNKEQIEKVRILVKTRTLTALRVLDSERNNQLLGFLREARFIGKEPSGAPKIDFRNADLRNADLKNADLSGVDLRKATLTGADLSGAKLIDANLREAVLTNVILDNTNFSNADLIQAVLIPVDQIKKANFCGAILNKGLQSNEGCKAGKAYVVAGTGLLVRADPAGSIIGSLGYGQSVTLTGRVAYAAGSEWSQLSGGSWVMTNYLPIQPSENTPGVAPSNK